jgi:glycosyltransferase involved in cell wall biosynthesis
MIKKYSKANSSFKPAILCLSHLAWDFVWQRPQHLLSRLARHYSVLYVNEPQLTTAQSRPYLERVADTSGVKAWQPFFPDRRDILEDWRNVYIRLVQELLLDQGWLRRNRTGLATTRPFIVWFYSPTPYYFLDYLPADLVVYDVMDELANFKNAAADLPGREAKLLAQADLVFTGGRSLYQARQGRHPHLHLFASGVEPDHFAQALSPATEVAAEVAALPRPVLGYYGVIDERIDLNLLDTLAADHPTWSIVMVGPVAKIELKDLPRRPNLYYPGQQPYARLPNFLKGFDVCLMPFQINAATRYISPTKTLEYMAAHKPIVSTPVPDVVANWADVVSIAASPAEFAAAVEQALAETSAQREARIAREEVYLACSNWDTIAAKMTTLIQAGLSRRRQQPHFRHKLAPGNLQV